jgi:hypothetical protein
MLSNSGDTEPRMDAHAADPVVEDASLPLMPTPSEITDAVAGDPGAGGARMGPPMGDMAGSAGHRQTSRDQQQVELARVASTGGAGYMASHSEALIRLADARVPRPDQEPMGRELERPEEGEGYVRLRVLAADGRLKIESHTTVAGPVVQPERLDYGWAYEARFDGRRLALGLVASDLGEQRSFPDPEGRPGMEGHHISPLVEVEFAVRIPQAALRDVPLQRVEIVLYRVNDPPSDLIGPGPLEEQFRGRVSRVAALGGTWTI